MRLSTADQTIIHSIRQGATLKAHRTVDGAKIHKVHPLQGAAFAVSTKAVHTLEAEGWVRSNMKFPVATYLLTAKGQSTPLSKRPQRRLWLPIELMCEQVVAFLHWKTSRKRT